MFQWWAGRTSIRTAKSSSKVTCCRYVCARQVRQERTMNTRAAVSLGDRSRAGGRDDSEPGRERRGGRRAVDRGCRDAQA